MANIEKLSQDAIDLIVQFEVGGGKKYYDRYLARISWPEGASGPTGGVGYDFAYESVDDTKRIFSKYLSAEKVQRLVRCYGMRGQRGKAATAGVRDIIIPFDVAMEIFEEETIPKYIKETLNAFPGSENLPDNAFGALVSLVMNRGALIDSSDRRREMRNIRDILISEGITNDTILRTADEVRAMSRLWPDNVKSDNDLHDRRNEEADLIEFSILFNLKFL